MAELMNCPLCGGQAIILNKDGRWCAECTGKPPVTPDTDDEREADIEEYDEGLDPEELEELYGDTDD